MYKSVETLLVQIPTIRPHKMAVATMQTQTLVLVKITTEDGYVGWGEATTIGGLGYGEESPESVKVNIETYFAPLLKTLSGLNVAQTLRAIKKNINGNRFAKCAIQTALLDIQAQRLNQPLSEILGGRLRNSVPVLWVLASGNTEKDIAEAQKMIAAKRHNIFKLKIGSRPVEQDVEHVLAIKQALGKDISIRVDVNRAWSELDAIKGIQLLQDGGIDLIDVGLGMRGQGAGLHVRHDPLRQQRLGAGDEQGGTEGGHAPSLPVATDERPPRDDAGNNPRPI